MPRCGPVAIGTGCRPGAGHGMGEDDGEEEE